MPEAMNDREKWWEWVREIRAAAWDDDDDDDDSHQFLMYQLNTLYILYYLFVQ